MSRRHRIFISYHHKLDQQYKDEFYRLFHHHAEAVIDGSVWDGDIDPNVTTETARRTIRDRYLRDTTVTVVLVGRDTWQRKHVDWEIGSSIRKTEYNPRSGLLGILLPTYPRLADNKYNRHTVPPRLWDNIEREYATMHSWSTNPAAVQGWIHQAFLRRDTQQPTNARQHFARNRAGDRWTD